MRKRYNTRDAGASCQSRLRVTLSAFFITPYADTALYTQLSSHHPFNSFFFIFPSLLNVTYNIHPHTNTQCTHTVWLVDGEFYFLLPAISQPRFYFLDGFFVVAIFLLLVFRLLPFFGFDTHIPVFYLIVYKCI